MQAAFALAGVDTGLVVLAGTGARAFGMNSDGKELHLDGLGPMVGDYGSGFHIGSLAIRAAAKADWHPRHHTSLSTAVFEQLKSRLGDYGVWGLVEYMGSERDRAEIAALSRLVDSEARNGDRIAAQLIREAAGCMAETVHDLVDGLDIADAHYTMVGTGSVATHSDLYWEQLCMQVATFAPRLTPWRSDLPAVLGLALIALKNITDIDLSTVRENLVRSTREMIAAAGERPATA